MIKAFDTALTGLRAAATRQLGTANNIANLNTPGYQATSAMNQALPTGGATTAAVRVDLTPGAILATGNGLDAAIQGSGYFKVAFPDGRTGYTRAGQFQVDAKGRLATATGGILQPPVNVPGNATGVRIGPDGSVTGTVDGRQATFGQIATATFANPAGLERGGGNVLYETAASGQPVMGAPGTGGSGALVPESVEGSNVDLATEAINLTLDKTAYKAQTKVIKTADEMLGSILDIKS